MWKWTVAKATPKSFSKAVFSHLKADLCLQSSCKVGTYKRKLESIQMHHRNAYDYELQRVFGVIGKVKWVSDCSLKLDCHAMYTNWMIQMHLKSFCSTFWSQVKLWTLGMWRSTVTQGLVLVIRPSQITLKVASLIWCLEWWLWD